MKKIIVAILAVLYMGISSGIAMDIHYCMGKETGVEFYGNDDHGKCDKCGMKDKKGCCGEEHKFYKLSDSHKSVSNDIKYTTPAVTVITSLYFYTTYFPVAISTTAASNYSPPDYARPSYCILNSIFRL